MTASIARTLRLRKACAMPGDRLRVTSDAPGTTSVAAVTAAAGPVPGVAVPAKASCPAPLMRAQFRITGALLLLAGLLPLIGIANPAMRKTFSGSNEEALKAVADHPVSTQVSGFLLAAGFAVAIPAVAALARVLDSHLMRLAVPLFAVGAGLTLADIAFGLKVSHDLATGPSFAPPPSWYGPMNDWGGALFTTGTGVLGAAALLACGWEILRRRALAPWSGGVTVAAAVAMLGQVAAFGGLLPFPQFLTFLALGVAALARSRRGQGAAGQGTAPPRTGLLPPRSPRSGGVRPSGRRPARRRRTG